MTEMKETLNVNKWWESNTKQKVGKEELKSAIDEIWKNRKNLGGKWQEIKKDTVL